MLDQLKKDMHSLARRERALVSQRYFKTGPGDYGEGDIFIGITVPQLRTVSRAYEELPLEDIQALLTSKVHEERLLALLIMDRQFKKADEKVKKKLLDFYLKHTAFINNWDLVDLSAPNIVGAYLLTHPNQALLTRLARSKSLWERRIAIVATQHLINNKKPEETLRIAELLLKGTHDLIHKAVGWMLREVGKRCSEEIEEAFLKQHYKTMPRMMLRYAIERFEPEKRQKYLIGTI